MGKSAQVPLHVWLPDSMEGPTPISALIHAATMVTAGIFMVARMSPLFELSRDRADRSCSVIGATTALFMGLLGIVQNDIKRVVAYSTLSQLGYMTVALGVSAYSAAIFHLMTHAFFKALLFLGAGSVIIAHAPRAGHAQDGRPAQVHADHVLVTCWIGSLALIGTPFFAGFYLQGRDHRGGAAQSHIARVAAYAYCCVLLGVFVTAFYTLPPAVHDVPRQGALRTAGARTHATHGTTSTHDARHRARATARATAIAHAPHESPWVVTVPLVLLAIPSVADRLLHHRPDAVRRLVRRARSSCSTRSTTCSASSARNSTAPVAFALHGFTAPPFWLAFAGRRARRWYLYLKQPGAAGAHRAQLSAGCTRCSTNKYYFDWFNETCFAGGARALGTASGKVGDEAIIDGVSVNGSARAGRLVRAASCAACRPATSTHYAFAMIIGLARAARLVPAAASDRDAVTSMHESALAVAPDLAADRRRRRRAAARRRAHRGSARWLALAVSLRRRSCCRIPLCTGFDAGTRGMQFVEQLPWIPALQHRTTTSASTASRCR